MSRPGTVVTSRAEAPPRSVPSDVGMAFIIGKTGTGPLTPEVVRSLTQYQTTFGARSSNTDMYDAVETFFREGGAKITVLRENDLSIAGALETALGLLTKDLGPGQLMVPGTAGQDSANHELLLAHAAANNRIALLDAPVDADTATLTTLAASLSALDTARYGALFGSPAIVPGIAGATVRTVPFSAVQAGIIARNDATHSPNFPSAGINGEARFATGLTNVFTDADRETLSGLGVNTARMINDGVRSYGYRTLAAQTTGWHLLSNARLNMKIVTEAEAIAERYVFAQLDGRGVKMSQFGGELAGMLVPFYEADALFGDTPADAFYVDVGAQVNTLETLAAGELHAVLVLRMSPFAEYVQIEIVKAPVETPLAVAA